MSNILSFEGFKHISAPHALATSNLKSIKSNAIIHFGFFNFAAHIAPQPIAPAPLMTTTSFN